MQLKVGDHTVEGSAEEIAALLEALGATPKRQNQTPFPSATAGPIGPKVGASTPTPFVSEEFAYKVLTRRELDSKYVALLKRLDQAGSTWTSAADIRLALQLSTREFAGLLGAFGRRVSHTEGANSSHFFDQYWSADKGHNLYRLPDSVRAALKRTGL